MMLTRPASTHRKCPEATSLQLAQSRLAFMNHSLQDIGHGFQTTAPHPGQWSNKEQGDSIAWHMLRDGHLPSGQKAPLPEL